MNKQRGAALLYAILVAVICTTLIAGSVQLVGQAAADQSHREKELRARAFALESLAILRSRGKDGLLTLPNTISRSGTGLSLSGTANADPVLAGVVNVEQTVRTGGLNFTFRDQVAQPYVLPPGFYFATVTNGSDNFVVGASGTGNATGAPDHLGADLAAHTNPIGRVTLSASGYFSEFQPNPAGWTAFLSALGLTSAQFANYDFMAISYGMLPGATFAGTRWEFWKGNSRLRIDAGSTGTFQGTLPLATYTSVFTPSSAPGTVPNSIRVILFDFDLISGGTPFRNLPDQLRTICWSSSSTTSPNVDALARLDTGETGPIAGILHEMGWPVRNNEANGFSTVLTRSVLSMPDNAGSGTQDVPLGSVSDNYGIYHGQLIPTVTGNYQFRFWTDDGSRLWVNDTMMVSSWWPQGPTLYTSGTIALTAGTPVPIWYEWWDWGGAEGRRVEWLPPGGSWQLIPDAQLRPGNGTEPVSRGHWGFNDGVSTGWTLNGIRTSGNGGGPWGVPTAAGIVQGQYLGDFGGNNARPELDLGTVAAGRIILTFEMFIDGGWESSGGSGPDTIRLRANGTEITNYFGAATGTSELRTTLPFLSLREINGWRNMRLEFQHSGGNLRLQWDKLNNSGDNINNESFLLDNVMVRRVR